MFLPIIGIGTLFILCHSLSPEQRLGPPFNQPEGNINWEDEMTVISMRDPLIDQALREFETFQLGQRGGIKFDASRYRLPAYIHRVELVMDSLNDHPDIKAMNPGVTVMGDELLVGLSENQWHSATDEERLKVIETFVAIWNSIEPESEHKPGAVLLWNGWDIAFAAGSLKETRM